MARLSDADQGRLPVPGFDSGGTDRAGPRALPRPGAAGWLLRHSGVAKLLLQVADDGSEAVPRARPVHSADEAEKYAAVDDGRGLNHTLRPGILRLVCFRE